LLKDSSLLKIHFGISGDFFTYFLLQYFQRTLFRFFAGDKDKNFIVSLQYLSSQNLSFLEQLLVKSGCKDKRFIFYSPNVFSNFLNLNSI